MSLIAIGVRKRSHWTFGLGIALLTVFAPLVVDYISNGDRAAITLGEALVIAIFLTLVTRSMLSPAWPGIVFGFVGVAAFGFHVFLLAHSP
jgi:hypothetical protein